jgi:hypothetical protein
VNEYVIKKKFPCFKKMSYWGFRERLHIFLTLYSILVLDMSVNPDNYWVVWTPIIWVFKDYSNFQHLL